MEQIISPGQGLLLLMDHYADDPVRYEQLKKYYLLGPRHILEHQRIVHALQDQILDAYTVEYSPHTITDDPTRRYFETHLAYWSLKYGLDQFDVRALMMHNRNLEGLIEDGDERLDTVRSSYPEEFILFFQGLADHSFMPDLTISQRDKLTHLVQSVILGLAVASIYNDSLPLDLYGEDFFEEKQRGRKYRVDKSGDSKKRLYRIDTQNWGLLKSVTPLARDDIAFSDKRISYLKPSDVSFFKENAAWVKYNFNRLVHPFSNSISGTMLVQLRVLAGIKQFHLFDPLLLKIDSLSSYFKLMTSAMILHSGGHSYFEFLTPITLDAVLDEFRDVPGFEQLNMESMLYTGNELAVEKAIVESRTYNQMTLRRGQLMSTIKTSSVANTSTDRSEEIVTGLRQLSEEIDNKYTSWLERTISLSDRRLMIHERLDVSKLGRQIQNADHDRDILKLMYDFLTKPQRTAGEKLSFFNFLIETDSLGGLTDLNTYIDELSAMITTHTNASFR